MLELHALLTMKHRDYLFFGTSSHICDQAKQASSSSQVWTLKAERLSSFGNDSISLVRRWALLVLSLVTDYVCDFHGKYFKWLKIILFSVRILRIGSLLFADDMVLFTSSDLNREHALRTSKVWGHGSLMENGALVGLGIRCCPKWMRWRTSWPWQ